MIQGMWEHDPILLQLPHFTNDLVKKCLESPGHSIKSVFDLAETEDKKRRELLQMSDSQLLDIAQFCYKYSDIDVAYEVLGTDSVRTGGNVTLLVTLERNLDGRSEVGPVHAPRYPEAKEG